MDSASGWSARIFENKGTSNRLLYVLPQGKLMQASLCLRYSRALQNTIFASSPSQPKNHPFSQQHVPIVPRHYHFQ